MDGKPGASAPAVSGEAKTMILRRRLGALLIVIGVGIAILPLLERAYGAYSQWQLERQWDAAVRQAQSRLPPSSAPPGSVARAWAAAPGPSGALRASSAVTSRTETFGAVTSTEPASWVRPLARFFSIRVAEAASPSSPVSPASRKRANRPHSPRASIHKSTTSHARTPHQIRHDDRPLGLVRLEIPRLKLRAFVVDGTSGIQLARGPAHFPGTALPGQAGNCAIAGHRNVYGSWFRDLNLLRPGDLIILRTPRQAFTYRVTHSRIVAANDTSILRPTSSATVTLVTCMVPHAKNRLIVFGKEIS